MDRLKYGWRAVRPRLISGVLYGILRFLGATIRMRLIDEPEDEARTIFCGWHGRSLLFANRYRGRGWWVIISQSNDGEMQTRIFRKLGFQIIRGSTGRGGVRAAVEAIRALKDGGTMAITPDGPRGPSGVVQGGVMLMAQKSGAKLVPMGISARPRIFIKSWDRYMFPLPFGRGIFIFGEPLTVEKDADEAEVERVRLKLQEEIHRLEAEAERMLGY
ncbi:lysophospholipid acyltransferase family protein [Fimbriimonas ginsengisoli]|uniref:3-Deoxy-D-manno-octulosonic-acid transferase n=1 Tax=Fimbriimonas ginsengisoli Gsoil 348 TaxID=661478 RepID=A0A068NMK8_FIMGI|nr:lysophospholipid acyltransferase family protein [Fimbriimonas ginsengisoli]AIE84691.1 3-Deoxy-D-manno-octulosonic-acid transferase [Fimbriimonas ginsengisoli Gsoil 348]